MRKIQKIISLEPMTSRLPSVLPAYLDNRLYFFDETSLRIRKYERTSNWGMVPVNIIVAPTPSSSHTSSDYHLTTGTHCYGGSSEYDNFTVFTLSFDTFSKWYYFFTEYYNLLNNYGHCDMTYSSATEYYKIESKSNYATQMVYGVEEETYIELDNTFAERGGVVEMITEDFKTSAVDNGFFKWMCENIVPSFTIPFEYRDYWGRNTLFYPDVVKELAWFVQRLSYDDETHNYGEYTPATTNEAERWNCKNENVDDCCDCEKYFGKGGHRTYDAMVNWYNDVQDKINALNHYISGATLCYIPTVIFPIELQNSVDDLGEYSIFSKDYELGVDYRTMETKTVQDVPKTMISSSDNTHGGTVVTVSGDSMMLVNSTPSDPKTGFRFDANLMEMLYDESAFTSYSQKYINEHPEEFNVTEFTKYCFTEDNRKVVWGNGEQHKEQLFAELYPITKTNSMYIDGSLYEIYKNEYGIYDHNDPYLSGTTYFVYRERGTDTPYTWINGKKIYASLYQDGANPPVYYFVFFKNENVEKRPQCLCSKFNIEDYQTFPRWSSDIQDENLLEYIRYGALSYVIVNTNTIPSLNVDETLIYRVDGTFIDRFGKTYYCSGATVYYGEHAPLIQYNITSNNLNNGCVRINITNFNHIGVGDSYWYCKKSGIISNNPNGNWCIVYKDMGNTVVYDAKILTGRTVSKIYDLRYNELLVDDSGQQIEGFYKVRPDYKFDMAGDDPTIYKKYSQPPQYGHIEPLYQIGNTANIKRFSMTVQDEDDIKDDINYFVGDIITNMEFYYADAKGEPVTSKYSSSSSLQAIKNATTQKENIERDISNTRVMMNDIKCDITYYIGATLHRRKNESYELDEDLNHGVKYTETVRFVKTEDKYYLRVPKKNVIPIDEFKPINNDIYIPIYTYKLEQDKETITSKIYDSSYDVALAKFEVTLNINNEFAQWGDMAERNNMEIFPVFREEYKMGISTIEKVDSDIYIDRGINASFEKHLKLGEVVSLEALEQYGNGYFKIIEG